VNTPRNDPHDYNEADTRKLLIDVQLREAGWSVEDALSPTPLPEGEGLSSLPSPLGRGAGGEGVVTAGEGASVSLELPVTGMPNNQGQGYVDYVLWGKDGKPLAVVEAKRALKDPDEGRQQAKLYADCLEKECGQRPIIFYSNGYETWLWDDQRAAPRKVQGFYNQDELALAINRRKTVNNPTQLTPDKNIAGRYYQHRAIQNIAEAINNGQRAALLTMATGTGKTRTAIALVELLMRANIVKNVLFLADRTALVNQAANAFKEHLPKVATVNLVTEKDAEGRVFASTYQTMMGLIDRGEDGKATKAGDTKRFGVGYFDLIVVDEAHRSVYQKFNAIFDYFDALLVGLTATPRSEVHRDTYQLFGLETGVPTDAYSLEEAVKDGFLVPPKAQSVPLQFMREGIHFDDLSDEEREHIEDIDWADHAEEVAAQDGVNASDVNAWLFNDDTIDKMLAHLMENGLKIDGGDKLGKTIIFARSNTHAKRIVERFDAHYPQYNGHFARSITYQVNYAQSLIDDFGSKDNKLPQIAVSVDMLDTGIDVPQVLNLVFFKPVRSKVKFLQMIGRGTRLCEDVFGPDEDKTEFLIFDYCQNFEFFNEFPDGADGRAPEPLGKRLFKQRLALLETLNSEELPHAAEQRASYNGEGLFQDLTSTLQHEVAAMNTNNFVVRPKREYVERYANAENWNKLDNEALGELAFHVAGLPSELPDEHITAKLFDLQILNMQLAKADPTLCSAKRWEKMVSRVMEMARLLEQAENVPQVKAELLLIQAIQTPEYWEGITLELLETLRLKLRGLTQFIEKKSSKAVYSTLTDSIGEGEDVTLPDFDTGINWVQYRKKVEGFIRAHQNHITIAKLRLNKPLTPSDLEELERFVFSSGEVGSREQFEEAYKDVASLPLFIRSLVGMDRKAAMEAFSQFLDSARYSSQQIRFVELIIDQLTANGSVDIGQLYEPPFTAVHYEGPDGVFPDAQVEDLLAHLRKVNQPIATEATG
jgi:type I restriction enzyme R subunit